MVDAYTQRNPYRILYNLIESIIEKVPDVNKERTNRIDPKERQRIFPEYPEANDEDYPRFSIGFAESSIEPYGGGGFVEDIKDDNDNVLKTFFGDYLIIPIEIGIFVKKDQRHKIVYQTDKSTHTAQNKMLADHMAHLVGQQLRIDRGEFIDKRFEIVDDRFRISPSYNDGKFHFAADIRFQVKTLDVWDIQYSQSEIIQTIVQNLIVDR